MDKEFLKENNDAKKMSGAERGTVKGTITPVAIPYFDEKDYVSEHDQNYFIDTKINDC